MSPNAMGNERARQIAQLKVLKSATDERLRTCDLALSHLGRAVHSIESIGKIPALTDVHKIGEAIRCLALAQIVQAELNVTSLTTEAKTLADAIQQAESPIARVSIDR